MSGGRWDLCAVCELPRFAHGWRIFRGATKGRGFVEAGPWLAQWYKDAPRSKGLANMVEALGRQQEGRQ